MSLLKTAKYIDVNTKLGYIGGIKMSGKSRKILKTAIRLLMIGLMGFSLFFCIRHNGKCFGDEVLTTIGLKAWSKDGHGTHYTVFYSLGIMLIAFLGYALTTKKRATTFLYFISGFSVLFLIANIAF